MRCSAERGRPVAQRNARDPKAVADASRRERDRAKRDTADLRWIMSDPRGRRFIWRMLGITGIFRSSFTGNSETFFREGERNVGLKLLTEVTRDANDLYLTAQQEAADEAKRDAVADETTNEESNDG